MPCLANSPSPSVTWQRPQIARPPQTESMSTPSARAACSTGVPSAKRPRLPEGVKTIRCASPPARSWPPLYDLPRKGGGRAARPVVRSGAPRGLASCSALLTRRAAAAATTRRAAATSFRGAVRWRSTGALVAGALRAGARLALGGTGRGQRGRGSRNCGSRRGSSRRRRSAHWRHDRVHVLVMQRVHDARRSCRAKPPWRGNSR